MKAPFVIRQKDGNGVVNLATWRIWTAIYGPKCAAWLVKRMRASTKNHGGFNVDIPRTVKLDSEEWRWFKLAVAFMRKTGRWRIRIKGIGDKTYEFRWLLSSKVNEHGGFN